MRPFRVPHIAQRMFSEFTWHKDRGQKAIYLTFDDGPVSGVTEFILQELESRNMKATFFMVGNNIQKTGDLARRVHENGHAIGNHTFHHLNGAKTETSRYLVDISRCQQEILDSTGVDSRLFRPPYGRITCSQKKNVQAQHEIVLWDLISWDFRKEMSPSVSLQQLIRKSANGSIVLFHDQKKTESFLRRMLPGYLDFLADAGYQAKPL
ncbi:Peptidoglycan/xylan/chitin deacetylase, PgdA/CDA1 family [Cyclobacterium lianum]|uniref:Peptidoglycan/xylan/chitin deacetylase, PgdA/CDA1 family n=1 Tax=Cyclobacterium lianum TaxID=388280 RepID=A0A1M7P8H3_9BACT|nr:polysaccharide deacetylase family protein [Cyclobacterium lianum]SHN13053.1 Peptidoglycan/xylan/chitin deacetylase, PgdA/CDA1 family [Cyclobacterium lianum]